jgi:hypothetical protein
MKLRESRVYDRATQIVGRNCPPELGLQGPFIWLIAFLVRTCVPEKEVD